MYWPRGHEMAATLIIEAWFGATVAARMVPASPMLRLFMKIRALPSLMLAVLWLSASQSPAVAQTGSADRGASSAGQACVVLLHGLGRTNRSMDSIARAARAEGYRVANIHYPSRSRPIEELAAQAVPEGLRQCRRAGATPINFITHSMGGLVLRYYLSEHEVPELGRAVMLAPPNQGSEIADLMQGNPLYDRVNGPAGGQLVTGPDGMPARLGPVDFPLGVITGNERTPFDGWFATQIPGENDGKVSVESAQVEGMTDFLILPVNHTFIVNDDEAIRQTFHFLRHERFSRD